MMIADPYFPTIEVISISSNSTYGGSVAKIGNSVTITFNASHPLLLRESNVTIADRLTDLYESSPGSLVYIAVVVLAETDAGGALYYSMHLTDESGNKNSTLNVSTGVTYCEWLSGCCFVFGCLIPCVFLVRLCLFDCRSGFDLVIIFRDVEQHFVQQCVSGRCSRLAAAAAAAVVIVIVIVVVVSLLFVFIGFLAWLFGFAQVGDAVIVQVNASQSLQYPYSIVSIANHTASLVELSVGCLCYGVSISLNGSEPEGELLYSWYVIDLAGNEHSANAPTGVTFCTCCFIESVVSELIFLSDISPPAIVYVNISSNSTYGLGFAKVGLAVLVQSH
jgi:hypothetical protein